MKLFLIRHAESKETDGDIVLTKKGIKQAKALAKHLKKEKIDKVYVSDLTRAKQTLEEYKKLNPHILSIETDRLREIYRTLVGGPIRDGTPKERFTKDKIRADSFIDEILKEEQKHSNILSR